MKKESTIGVVVLGLFIILNRFTSTPDLILGILAGIGICFGVIGLLPNKTYDVLKAWKKKF